MGNGPKASIERLSLTRKEGGFGHLQLELSKKNFTSDLQSHQKVSNDRMLKLSQCMKRRNIWQRNILVNTNYSKSQKRRTGKKQKQS